MTGEEFRWYIHNGVAVVDPPTELDMSNAGLLHECCQSAIDATGPRLVVDLARTKFLDSAILSTLVQVAREAVADGGWLRLASGNSLAVRRILDVTRLCEFLGNYPSVDDAISS